MIIVYPPCDGFTISIDIFGALGCFMSCLTISSAIMLSLGVVLGNCVGNYVGGGLAGVVVDGFGEGVLSSSLSYSSPISWFLV